MSLRLRPFGGFPPWSRAVAIPSLFFTTVLPRIEDPAELVVSIYFFFVQAHKKGQPRFVTYAELAADAALVTALDSLAAGGLPRGLNAAVQRGTLLRLAVEQGGRADELYCLNTLGGRRAVSAVKAGKLDLGQLLPSSAEPRGPRANIFDMYEQQIGLLTPRMADLLKEAEKAYPERWLEEAFRLAVARNKRSWSYIAAILRRWEAEGPDYEKAGRDTERGRGDRSPFDRYRHLIRR